MRYHLRVLFCRVFCAAHVNVTIPHTPTKLWHFRIRIAFGVNQIAHKSSSSTDLERRIATQNATETRTQKNNWSVSACRLLFAIYSFTHIIIKKPTVRNDLV